MAQVLRHLPPPDGQNLLVGSSSSDDAAVFRFADDKLLVSSVDFFPPIVDDPFDFGQVAAANSLSDIYAMGASPLFALGVVCFPRKLGIEVLEEITRGACEKLKEAGAILAGGHTIEDSELKYGLSVTGSVLESKLISNSGMRAGDVLVLTKPIGTGVISSALKASKAGKEAEQEIVASMVALNKDASVLMAKHNASACTDVTGFGFLGHLFEMCSASGASVVIESNKVSYFKDALNFVKKKKFHPKSIKTNHSFIAGNLELSSTVDNDKFNLLLDPQTSGGLLVSIPQDKVTAFLSELKERGINAVIVGQVTGVGGEARMKVV
ncbi:MAG: selenide, water dikinase SelD [Deltaproteobacteria bacterium]|nr:selenide, water dikinase SelD [Deltaproteobacteria bacterium]